jgi:nitroimidazol reductase NimA-like FMN-containing flavoprotein (pyridoxamine 5'-phosphate oxidase superfamily)
VVIGGFPAIFPVNYVVDEDRVVFRTDAGTKLDAVARSASVVFEVDHLDPATRSGWSVIVNGRADEITAFDSPEVRERASRLALYPWSPDDKRHLVCISASSVSGRRVRGT